MDLVTIFMLTTLLFLLVIFVSIWFFFYRIDNETNIVHLLLAGGFIFYVFPNISAIIVSIKQFWRNIFATFEGFSIVYFGLVFWFSILAIMAYKESNPRPTLIYRFNYRYSIKLTHLIFFSVIFCGFIIHAEIKTNPYFIIINVFIFFLASICTTLLIVFKKRNMLNQNSLSYQSDVSLKISPSNYIPDEDVKSQSIIELPHHNQPINLKNNLSLNNDFSALQPSPDSTIFEHEVAWLLNTLTEYVASVVGKSGDGGVDIELRDKKELVGIV